MSCFETIGYLYKCIHEKIGIKFVHYLQNDNKKKYELKSGNTNVSVKENLKFTQNVFRGEVLTNSEKGFGSSNSSESAFESHLIRIDKRSWGLQLIVKLQGLWK